MTNLERDAVVLHHPSNFFVTQDCSRTAFNGLFAPRAAALRLNLVTEARIQRIVRMEAEASFQEDAPKHFSIHRDQ